MTPSQFTPSQIAHFREMAAIPEDVLEGYFAEIRKTPSDLPTSEGAKRYYQRKLRENADNN